MTAATGAVFLSYAIEDSEAVQRIADALREVGVEVWFDKSESRGGDLWDRAIRDQIRRCRLFMPVISATTERRDQGYFRREWNLAADRMQDMADGKTFLFPVVIDATREAGAAIPERFRQVLWSRLPGGRPQTVFISRVVTLLSSPLPAEGRERPSSPASAVPPAKARRRRVVGLWLGAGVLILAVAAFYGIGSMRPSLLRDAAATRLDATDVDSPGATDLSIAVLPFTDLSEKHNQAYLGDGLAQQLTDLLTRVPDLSVAAQTSAFHFKGTAAPIAEVGAALRVAYVLEGSVREADAKLRITVQLIRVRDERQMISTTFERPTTDVFEVQDEITGEVLLALRVAPAGAPRPRSATTWAAYQPYLEGQFARRYGKDMPKVIAAYRASLAIDPNFAPAWAALAEALTRQSDATGIDPATMYAEARLSAQHALVLDPDLIDAQRTLAYILGAYDRDFDRADRVIAHAMLVEPQNASVLRDLSRLSNYRGDWDKSLEYARRAVTRDPLSAGSHEALALALHCSGQYGDAVSEWQRSLQLGPQGGVTESSLGRSLMMDGRLEDALQSARHDPDDVYRLWMIAQIQHAMGRAVDSDQSLAEYKLKNPTGNATGVAWIYAVQGHLDQAFSWFDKAYQQHDQGLVHLKCFPEAPAFTKDARYKALLRKVNLPQ